MCIGEQWRETRNSDILGKKITYAAGFLVIGIPDIGLILKLEKFRKEALKYIRALTILMMKTFGLILEFAALIFASRGAANEKEKFIKKEQMTKESHILIFARARAMRGERNAAVVEMSGKRRKTYGKRHLGGAIAT
jgi:hypothetical protein